MYIIIIILYNNELVKILGGKCEIFHFENRCYFDLFIKSNILFRIIHFFMLLSVSSESNQRDDQREGRLRSPPSLWRPIPFKRLFVLTYRSICRFANVFRTARGDWFICCYCANISLLMG